MCGFAGVVTAERTDRQALEALVRRMANTLVHRGPDDAGEWADEAAGVAFGFRRLSIVDLSPFGHQPMSSADGRYTVAFNGEIYNFIELRGQFRSEGAVFRGHSDTEVLLEAVRRFGPAAAAERLWGMFAFALWDAHERRLFLVRDRIGKKPLYYGRVGSGWVFGSELKALRAHPQFRAEVDREALAAFLRFGYVPGPLSIYAGVRKVRPGTLIQLDADGTIRETAYWSAADVVRHGLETRLTLSDEDAVIELDRLLRDAVARRMIADVPLGAFLSGGIDSSTVVALMQAQSDRPVRTFSIGFAEARYDEARHAREVARHLGTDHVELYVSPEEARSVIPSLATIYDEPFADSSQIPMLLVSQLARRHVTVSLSGDGGDELFSGYPRYTLARRSWAALRWLPSWARRSLAATCRLTGRDRAGRLADALECDRPDSLYVHLLSQWKRPERVVLGCAGDPSAGQPPGPSVSDDPVERMMYADLTSYLPDDILVKVDRASMAVSLEARAPLLDHRVVEWAWRLPLSQKQRGATGKWLLRQVLYRYVPSALAERPKMGFGVPLDSWLRGPLREWVEDALDERRLVQEGIFNPGPVRRAWAAHLKGRGSEQSRLWAILSFQEWRRASG